MAVAVNHSFLVSNAEAQTFRGMLGLMSEDFSPDGVTVE